jgi:hypothetical protein
VARTDSTGRPAPAAVVTGTAVRFQSVAAAPDRCSTLLVPKYANAFRAPERDRFVSKVTAFHGPFPGTTAT